MARAPIFTIGHSSHSWEKFVGLLQQHGITDVVDLRTTPGSDFCPHFNKDVLQTGLRAAGIRYEHFGKALGARRTEPHLLNSDRQLSWPKVKKDPEFLAAVGRIKNGANKGCRIALMCSEGKPIECHRFPMVAQPLAQEGFEILHILPDGALKNQAAIEVEMLDLYADDIPQPSIFEPDVSREQQLEAAYQQLNKDIGWPKQASRWPRQPD